MNAFRTFARVLSIAAIAAAAATASWPARAAVVWQDAGSLEVEGVGWADAAPFRRLPGSAKVKVNQTAWDQSGDSAGIAVRFVTDAAEVSVRWSLTNASLAMPHMPATGCSGLDLYAREAGGEWRFVGNCRPGKQDGNLANVPFADGAKPARECLLYLPLYNGTKSLDVGVPDGGHLGKPPARPDPRRKPIVVYGTSITQGGCASRPGMAWPSILGRMLDRPVINLGFSSSGDMAPPVGDVLAELDPAAYLIDCTWNMGTGKAMFLSHVGKLVASIRKAHPETPILFMGQSHIRPDAHPTNISRDQADAVARVQADGARGVTLIPATDFVGGDGEATVDGVHLNDLGMQRQAQAVVDVIRKAIGDRGEAPVGK